MNKIYYRYFFSLLNTQENWLNKIAKKGYRLVNADKLSYEFEECESGKYQYAIEFIADKSSSNAKDYYNFLEDMGYKVFFKNINVNYSIGKVRYRPWAKKGARLSTNANTFNKELLIIETLRSAKPLELHTTYTDKIAYYTEIRNMYLYSFFIFALVGILFIFMGSILFCLFALVFLIPSILYQIEIYKCKVNEKVKEW